MRKFTLGLNTTKVTGYNKKFFKWKLFTIKFPTKKSVGAYVYIKYCRLLLGLLTWQANLRYILYKMRKVKSPLCRKCDADKETSVHRWKLYFAGKIEFCEREKNVTTYYLSSSTVLNQNKFCPLILQYSKNILCVHSKTVILGIMLHMERTMKNLSAKFHEHILPICVSYQFCHFVGISL